MAENASATPDEAAPTAAKRRFATIAVKPEAQSSRGGVHFDALDSIRGLAALGVVFFHISWVNPFSSLRFFNNSYLMVDVFFVLSGFVVCNAYAKKLQTGADVQKFVWLRFWRLWPVHITFLFVMLIIERAKAASQAAYGLDAARQAFATDGLGAFVANVLMIHSLHIYPYQTFNDPSWSISVEFYTYIVFAAVVVFAGYRRWLLYMSAILIFGAFAGLFLLGPPAITKTVDWGILRCVAGFFTGVLVCRGSDFARNVNFGTTHTRFVRCGSVLSAGAFIAYLSTKPYGWSDFGVYVFAAALVFFVSIEGNIGMSRILCSRPLRWLGMVSYSIYMCHRSVIGPFGRAMRFLLHTKAFIDPATGDPTTVPDPWTGAICTLLCVICILGVSHMSYRFVEKPFRDWSRRAYPNLRRPAAPLSETATRS